VVALLVGQLATTAMDVIGPDNIGSLVSVESWATDGVPVFALAYAPDGALLYGAHGDRVTIWDAAEGSTVRSWPGQPSFVPGLAILPDGSLLATACGDRVVRLWDAASGTLQRELSPAGTHTVVFSHGGDLIASVGRDAGLRLWEVESGEPLWTTPISGSVFSVAFSPDDTMLVTAHGLPDFAVRVWSAETGDLLWESFEHEADTHEVRFSPNGETIASIGADTLVILWDAATGGHIRTLHGHQQPLFAMLYLSDRLLATGDGGGTIRIWDLETERTIKTLREHGSQVTALALSPDGTTLASASFDMEVILWGVP